MLGAQLYQSKTHKQHSLSQIYWSVYANAIIIPLPLLDCHQPAVDFTHEQTSVHASNSIVWEQHGLYVPFKFPQRETLHPLYCAQLNQNVSFVSEQDSTPAKEVM